MNEAFGYAPEQQEGEPVFGYNFRNSTIPDKIEARNPEEAIKIFEKREGRSYGSLEGDGFEALAT